jgi:hypothetical protein
MKAIQTTTCVTDVTGQSARQAETLPTGESISKAVTMGSKMCCGSSFHEHPTSV